MTTFDANTFGPDEVPVEVIIDGEATGYSTDVLIDIDGHRKHFTMGCYNFEDSAWDLYNQDLDLDIKHARWSFLPLAIYETNPELRKTVKL